MQDTKNGRFIFQPEVFHYRKEAEFSKSSGSFSTCYRFYRTVATKEEEFANDWQINFCNIDEKKARYKSSLSLTIKRSIL
jgi:hypothetical protein